MKNADMPAMPLTTGTEKSTYNGVEFTKHFIDSNGLTKREMFAMNAPDCPGWFEGEFFADNMDNRDYFSVSYDALNGEFPLISHDILPKGRMALIKAWRYAYADLILGD